jgi:hypothetical protein
MSFRTAQPMTAQGTRKGESSSTSVRNGLRLQPAYSVRGSSRRIMSMRFRPANIRVINRPVSCWAVIRYAVRTETLEAHQQERVPAAPPVGDLAGRRDGARRQGSASPRRALDCSAPSRPNAGATGGFGGNTCRPASTAEAGLPPSRGQTGLIQNPSPPEG